MKKRYGFSFDADRCIGCYACEIACQQWHGIRAGTFKLRRVEEATGGKFPDVKRTFQSVACRHCAAPSCAEACPEGAIVQREEDGIVVLDIEKCTGCRSCLEACPYGVPQFDENDKMHKCDMCLDRIVNGLQPICAATCPTQALTWRPVKRPSSRRPRENPAR